MSFLNTPLAGATQASDFAFVPAVWQDHIAAYFNKKLVFGSVADRDDTLTTEPGLSVSFPYFNAIGAAEEPAENAALSIDKLTDASFSATVKEVGKGVAITKKAFKKSAATQDRISAEVQSQIGRVMAEKVDADLLTELSTSGNYTQGFTAAATTDLCSIRRLNQGKIAAFGDRHDDAIVCFMHSKHHLDMLNDTQAGMLQYNAEDPMAHVQGYIGRLLGMALVVADTCPVSAGVTVASAPDIRDAFIVKAKPYGLLKKQELELESDYDILGREYVFTGNLWYAVKSYHGKVNALDKRSARLSFVTSI